MEMTTVNSGLIGLNNIHSLQISLRYIYSEILSTLVVDFDFTLRIYFKVNENENNYSGSCRNLYENTALGASRFDYQLLSWLILGQNGISR